MTASAYMRSNLKFAYPKTGVSKIKKKNLVLVHYKELFI